MNFFHILILFFSSTQNTVVRGIALGKGPLKNEGRRLQSPMQGGQKAPANSKKAGRGASRALSAQLLYFFEAYAARRPAAASAVSSMFSAKMP